MNTVPSQHKPGAPAPVAAMASVPGAAGAPGPAPAPGMRNFLLVLAAMLLPVLAYFGTARSIVAIWERSATFTHGYVIVPISLWLMWRSRAYLQAQPVKPCWPALLLLAGCGAAWLLGVMGDVAIVRQYAFAAMLPLSVVALLGTRVARAIAFPLAFLLFGVPVGESLLPPLIEITASFTIDALRLTGIPVLRDGNSFSIPSGNWSVVEACSGLRYLISSITLGALYAHLSYRSRRRQLLFVLAATLIPIAANSLRAYMIVMIGHLSNMKLAVGVDHLIYGWIFFGIVMMLLFWVGSFWREDHQPAPDTGVVAAPAGPLPATPLLGAALAVAAMLGAWPAYASLMEARNGSVPPVALAQFQAAAQPAAPFSPWQPEFSPASAVLHQFYQGSGQPVGLHVRYYRDEPNGGKLISSGNRTAEDHSAMRENAARIRVENVGGRALEVREAQIGTPGHRLLVWQWYWIDGQLTAGNYQGKLWQVQQKLRTGSDDGAVVMVFAEYDDNPDAARAALRAFVDQNLAPLGATLAANRRP